MEWLTLLAIALTPLAMGWFPYCGTRCKGPQIDCSACDGGKGPEQIEVEISGMVSSTFCSSCPDYDGIYILDSTVISNCNSPFTTCCWFFTYPSSICRDGDAVPDELFLAISAASVRVGLDNVDSTQGRESVGFWVSTTDFSDCTNWNEYSLGSGKNYLTFPAVCSDEFATCTITAI